MNTYDRRNRWPRLAIAVLLLMLLAALAGSFRVSWNAGIQPEDVRRSQWRRQLAAGSDGELVSRIRSELTEDEASLELIVEALASGRPVAAEAARAQLMANVDRLQLRQSRNDERRIARIIHELARQVPNWPNDSVSRRSATELATRVLVWTVCHRATEMESTLIDCETVLRVGQRPTMARGSAFVIPGREVATPRLRRPYQPNADAEDQFALPGGQLPVEICGLSEVVR